ncbi:hypothetical protein BG011_002848 [Mortierella polycephala]|uniref:Uncharacterized protein n=1 Tax=Mortierella polycephala TaxID=41804 RepID=A0A9P6Q5S2_9FUNG|nr:hypothetical protein BG011_002848 [Mortierella polycephala]
MTFDLEEINRESNIIRVQDVQNVKPFVDAFLGHGHTMIDTDRIYCGGDTEKVREQEQAPPLDLALSGSYPDSGQDSQGQWHDLDRGDFALDDALESNLDDLEKEPLPDIMIQAFNQTWDHVMAASRHYTHAF